MRKRGDNGRERKGEGRNKEIRGRERQGDIYLEGGERGIVGQTNLPLGGLVRDGGILKCLLDN